MLVLLRRGFWYLLVIIDKFVFVLDVLVNDFGEVMIDDVWFEFIVISGMMNLFECVGLLFLWYLLVDFEWWEVLMGGFFFFVVGLLVKLGCCYLFY